MGTNSIMIVEDEPVIADDIASTLVGKGYSISAIVDNADEAMSALSKVTPSLLLLDVKIRGAKDGITLAHEVRTRFQVPFIFITSFYDSKTLDRAKLAEPQGYIVKPFDDNDLIINVELALYKTRNRPAFMTDKFFVKDNNEMIAVHVDDILYVEAFDNYSKVSTSGGVYIVSHTLKSVEEKLAPKGFVRVHRSYLVNFQKITSISEGQLFLGMTKIPLGYSYREDLLRLVSLL